MLGAKQKYEISIKNFLWQHDTFSTAKSIVITLQATKKAQLIMSQWVLGVPQQEENVTLS